MQTDTTDVGTVIDARTNVSLPLASRNYLQLTLLTPGAVTVQPSGFETGQNAGQVTRPEINGNRFDANSFLLDGMDNNDTGSGTTSYSPQPDAIEEFRIITQNAPADFGNYMGGVISASIKSGTNSFHGAAFEFFRNDVLNANQWQNKLIPGHITPRQKMRWNEFGGAVGGPIIKDKLFFFADYQGERFDFPSTTSFITVFTAKERMGDVSELVAAGKNIVNPLTGLPFTNNVIPQLSAAASAILKSPYYPTPINSLLQSNATNTTAVKTDSDQGDGRFDYTLSDKDHIMGRFPYSDLTNPTINSFALKYNPYGAVTTWNFVTGYTRTLSSSLVNDARLGVNYVQVGQNHTTANFSGNAQSLFNIPGLTTSFLPAISFSGGYVSGFGTKDSVTDNYDASIQYSGRCQLGAWEAQYAHRLPGLAESHQWIVQQQQWTVRKLGFRLPRTRVAPSRTCLLGLPTQVGAGSIGSDWGQRNNGVFAASSFRTTRS